MRVNLLAAVAAGALALSGGAAMAQTLPADVTGWYNSTGASNNGGGNYFSGREVGEDDYRGFIVFTIPEGEPISGAQLNIFNSALGQGGPNVLGLFDVTTGVPVLVAGTGGTAAFEDLADGPSYGTAPAPTGSVVSVTFTPAGITALNAAQGESFAIGLINTTIEEPSDNLFYSSIPDTRNQLILSRDAVVAPASVPTLSEWAMILLGLMIAGATALHLGRRRAA